MGGARPGAGRPKGSKNKTTIQQGAELSALARSYTEEAIRALVDIAVNGESETARVAAADRILDRGYGRPPQALLHSGPDGGAIEHRLVDDAERFTSAITSLAAREAEEREAGATQH